MILTVLAYNERENYHECKIVGDVFERIHRVDLLVDNSKVGTTSYLIGKKVEVQSLTPYIEIAHGVKIL